MGTAVQVEGTRLTLVRGDVTRQEVDAIVNAANSGLLAGSGVCGAIFLAAGPVLEEATDRIRAEQGDCDTGDAVITPGGDLFARWVVHAVGPVWGGGGEEEPELLARCHRRSLEEAVGVGARTIAFPAISTGIYGFPIELAAPIALGTAAEFARENDAFTEIRFVLFSEFDHEIFTEALSHLETGR